jgi:hypothetical protein
VWRRPSLPDAVWWVSAEPLIVKTRGLRPTTGSGCETDEEENKEKCERGRDARPNQRDCLRNKLPHRHPREEKIILSHSSETEQ